MSAKSAFDSVQAQLRSYMRIAEDDPIDLAVMAAIVCNFAPDRVNPLWFVLIGSSEAGKSLLLDVMLSGWDPVEPMPNRLTQGYFFSARTGEGALDRVQKKGKRLLYMRDMASLLALPMTFKAEMHNQIIGVYDGEYRHETGMTSRAQVYHADPFERLGWIGAATEAFYERFLMRTYQAGARFTAWYWRDNRPHWTDYDHLRVQRELRGRRLSPEPTRIAVQAFLDESISRMGRSWSRLQMSTVQGKRIDAATTLVLRIIGSGGRSTARGGRTSDRASQFVRACAHVSGAIEVESDHVNLGVKLILSQLPVEYQELLGYAVRPENLRGWKLRDFLQEVGGHRKHYLSYRGGPLDNMIDAGVIVAKGAKKEEFGGSSVTFRLSDAAWQLAAAMDPVCAELKRPLMDVVAPEASVNAAPEIPSEPGDDEADRALAMLRDLSVQ